jgi:hypothetical protein
LELKLEAVMIGGQTRTAIINGAVYRERDELAAEALRPSSGPRPRVIEIQADHVTIGWREETLRLNLERGSLAPGDRIAPISAGTRMLQVTDDR